jgi:hypothetical protein
MHEALHLGVFVLSEVVEKADSVLNRRDQRVAEQCRKPVQEHDGDVVPEDFAVKERVRSIDDATDEAWVRLRLVRIIR